MFAHIVIGDEINRASPKTQSALLECMQEAQATVDGRTYPLPRPFLVVATQNPVEMEGTYPLPEAQRDRFMARLTVGYPSIESELDMLDLQETSDPLDTLAPVTDAGQIKALIETTRRLYASPAVKRYIVDLVTATRVDAGLRLGASPSRRDPAVARGQGPRRDGRPGPRAAGRRATADRPCPGTPAAAQHRVPPVGSLDLGHRLGPRRPYPAAHAGLRRSGPSHRRLMRLRPTARGWALAAAGVAALQFGVVLGSVDLVRIGTLVLLLVVAAAIGVLVFDPGRGRHRLGVTRTSKPNPVHAGSEAQIEVVIAATDPAARVRLAGLKFAEQAATELSGGRPLRARVSRAPRRVTVSYAVQAARRGRWPLGPLVVTRSDPFGVMRASATLGEQADVAVWPTVVSLPTPADVLVGEPDRVALGARTPSTDDASLRDYREGDDLRRVHWSSSARRGALMVRSDERAGMRPVSVLLGLPARASVLEWSISLAASMALAMLEGGHPDPADRREPVGRRCRHRRLPARLRARSLRSRRTRGRARPHASTSKLRARTRRVRSTWSTPRTCCTPPTRPARSCLPCSGRSVRPRVRRSPISPTTPRRGPWSGPTPWRHVAEADETIRALRRAGWRACRVTPEEPIVDCWLRLLGSAS